MSILVVGEITDSSLSGQNPIILRSDLESNSFASLLFISKDHNLMPKAVRYGVECKNKDCAASIIFSRYLISPKTAEDPATMENIVPGKLKCTTCGFESDYTHDDLKEFPA